MTDLKPIALRLDPETLALLDAIAADTGTNRTTAVRLAARELAERRGLRQRAQQTENLTRRPGRPRKAP